MPKRNRAPNCTHLDMDRVYGRDQDCEVCGRPPSIGFLYECRQDWATPSLRDMLLATRSGDETDVVKSDMRLQLEWLGLSESVIRAAEQGHYTPAQVEKLKTQKKDLRETISDSLQASQINDAAAKLAALDQTPSNNDGSTHSAPRDDTVTCVLKACHTCRPYYRDRVYISFQSVLEADFAPVTRDDVKVLPTKSAQIMRSIGNVTTFLPPFTTSNTSPRSLPTSTSLAASTEAPPTASTATTTSSGLTFKTTQTDLDAISAQRHPRRRFYKIGHRNSGDIARDLSRQPTLLTRHGLRSAIHGIFRPTRDPSSSGSNITLPVPRTGTVRNSSDGQDVGDFDLPALRKVRREKERMEVKKGTYVVGYEDVQATPSTCPRQPPGAWTSSSANDTSSTEDSMYSVYSFAGQGSEVAVEGGVALTEEAVETHTPDILAPDVSPALKHAVVVRDAEMNSSDDEDDGGLHSIMAQV
ncbi:hypothetical protein BDU57DRAFT_439305 [Ampelomyces quisqualis]|uniref:Uncharacterized protein n=1 Tax=Ampelomyces quisqualis TaxID=50730 RepID=A0A6A5R2E6_AMPQU|nr:hypothetical protein BDU57DRAFT_439305 [Ampelomyces quisqualis]